MRVSLCWLAEWIDLPAPASEIAERLTASGLEVEGVECLGPDLSGVRVGLVLEREKHPNADRLSLCRVDAGDGAAVDVVCGAPNVAAGQKIAFAPAGTKLPDGRVLERSKIRGVVSNGMICSARELGLGDEAGGILVLDSAATVGAALSEVIPSGDSVLEVAVPSNRGDCASILGVAREVHALFGGEIRIPPVAATAAAPPPLPRIAIEDPEGCNLYVGRIVEGVRIGPSPDWVVARLETAGLRSINNVVDVTNLVLLEFGQPLHAFDLSKLRGETITVRSAHEGEAIETLDGVTRKLAPEDLVIADADAAIAIAGVMGGAGSQVGEATTNVLVESAHFAPGRIRRTARRLGISSEASYRFERGVDPDGVARAADRAARLLEEIAGGCSVGGAIITQGAPREAVPPISLDPDRVNRLLGTSLAPSEVASLLARVGVASSRTPDGSLRCEIPSHRSDLRRYQDLVEEVVRIHGCDRVPTTLPLVRLAAVETPPLRVLADRSRDAFVAAGFFEAVCLSFLCSADLDRLDLAADDPRRRTVVLSNPISEEHACLRSTLVASLLRAARENLAHRVDRVRLFEVSRVFFDEGPAALPREPLRAAALVCRAERTNLWESSKPPPIYFEARGVAERVLRELGHVASLRPGSGEPFLHPGASAEIRLAGLRVGSVGEIHPEVARRFSIDRPCAIVDLDLETLAGRMAAPAQYREVSQQPPVRRDLALLVARRVAAGDLLEAISKAGGRDLVSVDLFDRYEGPGVPDDEVSLAFRLVFQRLERAFTDAEITKQVERIVSMLGHRFGAELRSAPGGGA
ncbi:phenylalanyl-tRNA synthetase beta chain [Myxococcaceae bacterium]|nr:phenylalanyl-tRNA synthetase beta chain [Myxococcaceae bacterium]